MSMNLWFAPRSSEHTPCRIWSRLIENLVWFSQPHVVSVFTPSLGIVHEHSTSAAVNNYSDLWIYWLVQLGYPCLVVGMLLFVGLLEVLCVSQTLALWSLIIHRFSIIGVLLLLVLVLGCGICLLSLLVIGIVLQWLPGWLLVQLFKSFQLFVLLVWIAWFICSR
jgi:hypothetical protein